MNDPRWTTVDGILEAALERDPQERASFLREACAGNETLRGEVESLLAHAKAEDFLDRPAHDVIGRPPTHDHQLPVGHSLGQYHIVDLLGRGGMGEVYRAHDTTLGRDVAIKILPSVFTTDADRRARFDREARVLAALNHPHIGAIYGVQETDGVRALVLELVEGGTLADRIATGALPVQEALSIARQIAEALEAAHEKGVVHRDLKPANVKITSQGVVKVLDFGLAKATADASGPDPTEPPTVTAGSTRDGVILGTAAYMSPEQARGKPLDKRTDIWAFGCVLYEMLAGRPAFQGESATDILAQVIERDPDWSGLPARLPERVNELLRRCLEKDPRKRRRDIGDVRLELERAPAAATILAVPDGRAPRDARRAWIAATVIALVLTLIVGRQYFSGSVEAPQTTVDIATPETADASSFAISPDGRRVVLTANHNARQVLYLRSLDEGAATPLAGTEDGRHPFWSPNGRSIGFATASQLKRIDLDGRSVQELGRVSPSQGGTWGSDGVILFSPSQSSPIYRVAATGGEAVPVTRLGAGQTSHRFPSFLPGRREFLFYAFGQADMQGIYLASLDSADAIRLADADTSGMFMAPGWLLFVHQGTLTASRFDLTRRELSGDPVTVATSVAVDTPVPRAAFSASAAGAIAYRTRGTSTSQLTWFDRSGRPLGTLGEPDGAELSNLDLSHDGSRVAAERTLQNDTDVWIVDSSKTTPFASGPGPQRFPIWSIDDTRVMLATRGEFVQKSVGANREEPMAQFKGVLVPTDWSPDGRFVLCVDPNNKETGPDLTLVPTDGGKPIPFVNTRAAETWGQFSPDGHWVAYQSNESGQNQIFVRAVSGQSRSVQVSISGGTQARWSRDAKEVFYIAPNGTLMTVPIAVRGGSVEGGTPESLFQTRIVGGGAARLGRRQQYDVAPDGRFLINVALENAPPPINLILNWKGP